MIDLTKIIDQLQNELKYFKLLRIDTIDLIVHHYFENSIFNQKSAKQQLNKFYTLNIVRYTIDKQYL